LVDQWNVSPKLASAAIAVDKQPRSLDWLSRATEPYLKFVLHKTNEIAEVDALLAKYDLADFPSHRIIISPGGKKLSHMEPRLLPLADAALERGWRFTPRLHVILWGDKRGV
ncbi:MAG: 7-carboxy-7-deazaguanine synthase QueE, partial [Nitrospinaceae bacterium]|nr:7-carboxy-7-deazaguanine synthase QueE [Nitrospinaceae bacterium]